VASLKAGGPAGLVFRASYVRKRGGLQRSPIERFDGSCKKRGMEQGGSILNNPDVIDDKNQES